MLVSLSTFRLPVEMADQPSNQIALSWTPEFAAYAPSKEHKAWAITTLKAPFYEPTARAPVDICAVIDRSGSMHGEKLELVKETLEFVIDQCEQGAGAHAGTIIPKI